MKTLERIELLHPNLRNEAKHIYEEICEALSIDCVFTHTYRSIDEQNGLYAKGRTTSGKIVTNSRGGQSYHNYGLAIDIAFIVDGKVSYDTKKDFDKDGVADWMEVVRIFKSYGWEWGGDWKFLDLPHFQKTFGYSIKALQKAKMIGGYPVL
jgi:peptidoglycan L-alanyl-D-glutamate endopeptidase CwlK